LRTEIDETDIEQNRSARGATTMPTGGMQMIGTTGIAKAIDTIAVTKMDARDCRPASLIDAIYRRGWRSSYEGTDNFLPGWRTKPDATADTTTAGDTADAGRCSVF